MSEQDGKENAGQASAIITALVKALPIILPALGLAGGGTAGYMKGSADTAAQYQQIIENQNTERQRSERIESTMLVMQGALDACRNRPAWDDMPEDYYRGIEQQMTVAQREREKQEEPQ